MAQIKARIAHAPEELESTFFFFDFYNYAVPATVQEGGYLVHFRWGYLNANGYVQMFDPAKPPSKFPTPERAILVLNTLSNSAANLKILKDLNIF